MSTKVRGFFDRWNTTIISVVAVSCLITIGIAWGNFSTVQARIVKDVDGLVEYKSTSTMCDTSTISMIRQMQREYSENHEKAVKSRAELYLRVSRIEKKLGLPPMDWDNIVIPNEAIK
jgi:hypothetical protein